MCPFGLLGKPDIPCSAGLTIKVSTHGMSKVHSRAPAFPDSTIRLSLGARLESSTARTCRQQNRLVTEFPSVGFPQTTFVGGTLRRLHAAPATAFAHSHTRTRRGETLVAVVVMDSTSVLEDRSTRFSSYVILRMFQTAGQLNWTVSLSVPLVTVGVLGLSGVPAGARMGCVRAAVRLGRQGTW